MRHKIVLSQEKEDLVLKMGSLGFSIEQIAKCLSIDSETIRSNKEINKKYQEARGKLKQVIVKTAMQKAIEEKDNTLLIFLMKVQCGFHEREKFVRIENFEKMNYSEKCDQIDKALKDKRISVKTWKEMHETISLRYVNEEYEKRIQNIEEAIEIDKAKKKLKITEKEINNI